MSFWKNRPLIIAIILIIVFLTLLITTANTDTKSGPVSVVGRLIAPVQRFFYGVTESLSDLFQKNSEKANLQSENADLKAQIEELKNELLDYDNLYQENIRLKDLLDFVGELEGDPPYVAASVIGKSPGEWFSEFTISAGSDDGIQNGMIVYSADGLVGRIVYTAGSYSRVLSIIDDESGVAVLIERTRDNGVLKSAGEENQEILQIDYLPSGADVVPGDKILTSGIGGIYPKGIEVGTVSEVGTNTAGKTVNVKSAVDFAHLEEVVVVLQVFEEVE